MKRMNLMWLVCALSGLAACNDDGSANGEPSAAEFESMRISSIAGITAADGVHLEHAVVGLPYQVPLTVDGGRAPYLWQMAEGALPSGLELTADGLVRGVPMLTTAASFAVDVVDAGGETVRAAMHLNILATGVSPYYVAASQAGFVRRGAAGVVQRGELRVMGEARGEGDAYFSYVQFDLPETSLGAVATPAHIGVQVKYVERGCDLFATPAEPATSWTWDTMTWETMPTVIGGCLMPPCHLEVAELSTAILRLDSTYAPSAERTCTYRIESSGPEVMFRIEAGVRPAMDRVWLKLEYRAESPVGSNH